MKEYLSTLKPFKMFGKLYYVGDKRVSVHLIDTPDGLVIIDTGYPDMYEQIKDSIEYLGFDVKNICAIFHSHGHYDHFGCTLRLRDDSGAKLYISRIDNEVVNGNLNLSWAEEAGLENLETFDCDVLIEDGDIFTFGDTQIRCVHTPGHTDGVMSFFITLKEGDETVVAAMHGGLGLASMKNEYLKKKNLSYDCRRKFRESLHKLKDEKVDLVIGNHPEQTDTSKKLILVEEGKSIINKNEWQELLIREEERFDKVMAADPEIND